MGSEATRFKPGNRAGRKAGTGNKIDGRLKEHFLEVYEELQEEEGVSLKDWARENPTEFYKIIAKLLPQEYTGDFYTVIEVNLKEENANTQENDFG